MSSLLTCVEDALAQAGLLQPPGQTIVAAVSGGPDSLALLHLLHAAAQRHPIRLHCAHLDHGLRGAEAEADAAFVQEACRRLGVVFHTERADVLDLQARLGLSLEAAAREARYSFLARVTADIGAAAVATGHTQDDQAETVLLHLLRGSGLRGFRGMLPLSRWQSRDCALHVSVVRPLLQAARQETETYCRERSLSPRWDASNAEERFQRNRIRLSVMPLLRQLNPNVVESLTRLAVSAARDIAYLSQQVDAAWPGMVTPRGDGLRIGRQEFLGLHPSVRAHLLQRAYVELAGEASELAFTQIDAMLVATEQGAGREITLGHGLRFFTTREELLLAHGPLSPPWPPIPETPLPLPGEAQVGGWRIVVRTIASSEVDSERLGLDPYQAFLDAESMGQRLWLRVRQPGDRFHPLGAPGEKKLKAFFIDSGVPRQERDCTPLLLCEQGIAWVVGHRIAHWARVTASTERVLEVRIARDEA